MPVTSLTAFDNAIGNGSTTSFPYDFAARSADEIAVYVNGTLQVSGYTVVLNAGFGGGTVTFTTAPANGAAILIQSNPSFQQNIEFVNAGAYNPAAVDGIADEGAIRDIYLNDNVGRSVRAPLGEAALAPLPAKASRANMLSSFDANGNPSVLSPTGITGAKGDPGSPGEGYSTRTAMAARLNPAVFDDVYLTEKGREGKFVVDLASNWTGYGALATIDPQQGVFVPSTADATKVYVRVDAIRNWVFNVRHFGAVLDNSTDDHVAIAAAVSLSYSMRRAASIAGVDYGNGGGPAVCVPGFGYMGANTLTFNHSFRFFGFNRAGIPSTGLFGLRWADGVTGIENPGRAGIFGLDLIGGFAGTEAEHHAIHATQTFQYRDLTGGDWGGDFMNLDTSGSGNVDGVIGENVWVYNCRDAYNNLAGSNNSAGAHKNWNIDSCRRWGFNENTFLGVSHYGHETANCGITSYNNGTTIGASVVSYSGNRYCVIAGQETWCSTNSPTGTTLDNQGWAYISAGGVQSGMPAWTSGILCRAGGSYYCPGSNVGSEFFGCYHESGQGLAQILSPAVVYGFAMGGSLWKGNSSFFSAVNITGSGGQLLNKGGFKSQGYIGTDETVTVQVGEVDANNKTVWALTGSVSMPLTTRVTLESGDIVMRYNGSSLTHAFTGPNTTQQFGRGAAVPYVTYLSNLAIGSTEANARIITMLGAAPTTGAHAVGEIVFNLTPAASGAGSNAGWRCTTAGTPGTWVQYGGVAAHMANLTAAPTQTDFNNLLSALQTAGLMA